jgi:RNA polymerase sigma-70 factor (family 1)
MINQSDKELLQGIVRDEEQAFQVLFDRHWQSLFSFVYRLTRDESQTKDILQDVFIDVWNNRDTLYSENSLLPYLNTIARNKVMSAFRRDRVRLLGKDILKEDIDRSIQSDERLLFNEVKLAVDDELFKMSFTMRSCFQLSRYEDKSIREIAKELSLSERTVKNNISEALRRLRIVIKDGSLLYLLIWLAETSAQTLTQP